MMIAKHWTILVLSLLLAARPLPLAIAFAPSNSRSSAEQVIRSSTTALEMTTPQKHKLQAAVVASLIALTVATAEPLPSFADQAAVAASSPPQVTITPFGGGFGGMGLSPFGLNPFGGLGAGTFVPTMSLQYVECNTCSLHLCFCVHFHQDSVFASPLGPRRPLRNNSFKP